MKKAAILVLGMILIGAWSVSAQEGVPSVPVSEAVLVEVGNKICPVSQEKVGEMGPPIKYTYKGKVYNLCCPSCIKDFQDDPEKYSKVAEEEVSQK